MKVLLIVLGVLVVFVALPLGITRYLGSQTRGKAEDQLERLENARQAREGERLVDGTVGQALEEWVEVEGRRGVALERWRLRREGDLATREVTARRFVPFVLETEEGSLIVAGRLESVVDPRIPWRRGGSHELFVQPGERVSVLGAVGERGGQRGFFGPFTLSMVSSSRWIEIQRKGVAALR